jgi:hypothetical protein
MRGWVIAHPLIVPLEPVVSKKSKSKRKKEEKTSDPVAEPWISMRSGVKIMAITSIGLAILTAWQVIPSKGWLEGVLWGLVFGGLIWLIFFGNILLNRFLHK